MSTTSSPHAFRVEYIQPFVDSLKNLFVNHLAGSITIGKPELNRTGTPRFEISGVITFTGTVVGRVVVCFPDQVAVALVKAYLGMEELPEGVVDDCVGEMANIIVGRAKSDMEQHQIVISPPTIVRGRDYQISAQRGASCLTLPCETHRGPIAVEISIAPGEGR